MPGISGVGVSFGADRIYDVLSGLNQFETIKTYGQSAMIINFGEKELNYNLNILAIIHQIGITAEIFPEPAKMKKQLAYADSKKVTYVLMAGEDEIKDDDVTVKNMLTGEQVKIKVNRLLSFFK
jgi:histidyl-tRNA synthetase